jgi:hypothetical protein
MPREERLNGRTGSTAFEIQLLRVNLARGDSSAREVKGEKRQLPS